VVIEGLVEVTYFDLDQTKIGSFELKKGQVSITLHGGHSYRTLNAAAKVYEFKTGPYEGQEIDKRFL
jgi:hypothetical protein